MPAPERIPERADVVVIGAGPAGSAAAIALAGLGHHVVLLERRVFPRPRIGESLPPKVTPLLAILGAREQIEGAGFVRMAGTTVEQGSGRQTHEFDPVGRRLGFQVDRGRFDALLLTRARQVGARAFEGKKVIGIERRPDEGVSIRWGSPEASGTIEARFVVDASGGAAVVTRAFGLRQRDEQRTVALAGYWGGTKAPTDFSPANTIFEMIEDGWIWSVLHADGRRNITLGIDASRVKNRARTYADFYRSTVQSSRLVGPLLEGATMIGELSTHDATWARADRYAGDGYLLTGDAASVIDPLTSQGVYKALQSSIAGAAVINTVLRRPEDRALALGYYQDSQARFAANYAEIALSFYRRSPFQEAAFWRQRTSSAFATKADVEVADLTLIGERRVAFSRLVSQGADRVYLRLDPRVRVELRPVAEAGLVVSRPTWMIGEAPIDAEGVDPAVFGALLDGRSMVEAFEAYAIATAQPRSAPLGRQLMLALANLVERSLLTISAR